MAIKVMIVDDHGVMRAGLKSLLLSDPSIAVVGEAASGEEALKHAGVLHPDIVLLDIGLPGIDGIETTRQLKQENSQVKVLILTVYEDESLLRAAIRAGASGFVMKRAAGEDLLSAIQVVSQGYMYIHPAMTHLLVQELMPSSEPKLDSIEALTPRELEVMGYIIRGYTNRQIAETLFISMRTVEGHRASLFGKLGLKNRVELIEYAEKHGLKG